MICTAVFTTASPPADTFPICIAFAGTLDHVSITAMFPPSASWRVPSLILSWYTLTHTSVLFANAPRFTCAVNWKCTYSGNVSPVLATLIIAFPGSIKKSLPLLERVSPFSIPLPPSIASIIAEVSTSLFTVFPYNNPTLCTHIAIILVLKDCIRCNYILLVFQYLKDF